MSNADMEDTKAPESTSERNAAWMNYLLAAFGLQHGGRRRSKHSNAQKRKGYGHARRLLKSIRRRGVGA